MALEKSQENTWIALDNLRKHLDESMDRLRNRLPVWATLVLSILTGLVGVLLALSMKATGH